MLLAGLLLLAGPSNAEVLGWNGTLVLDFLAAEPEIARWVFEAPGLGISSGAPPVLGALHLTGGLAGSATFLVTDPDTIGNSVAGVRLEATLGFGTLSPLPPLPFGERLELREIPLLGALRVCLLTASCVESLTLLRLDRGPSAIGVGGTLTGSTLSGARISIQAAPWTLGTATVPFATTGGGTATAFAFGFVHGPVSFTGTTGVSGGELQLVTPMLAASPAATGLSGFGRLGIRFVPEPGAGVLLGAACLFLLFLARQRLAP